MAEQSEQSAPSDRGADAARIAAGYATSGTALEFGSVVLDGAAHSEAQVRVPLAMINRHGLIAGATGTGKTKTLQKLGTGEAVVTVLSESGAPTPVAWARMRAPRSLMVQADAAAQQQAVAGSPLQAKYGTAVDRESAYELLNAWLGGGPEADAPSTPEAAAPKPKSAPSSAPRKDKHDDSAVEQVLKSSAFKSFARSAATVLGREITRGVFGTRKR